MKQPGKKKFIAKKMYWRKTIDQVRTNLKIQTKFDKKKTFLY